MCAKKVEGAKMPKKLRKSHVNAPFLGESALRSNDKLPSVSEVSASVK